jgi:hypothetical protein
MSMTATLNSMDNPTRGGISTPKRMISEPTMKMVIVCPIPQTEPMKAALRMLRCLLTMVEMATT